MNGIRLRTRVRSLRGTALASLRIVGLMYTSLAGILALALVIAVALLPVSPGFQDATQPAREAVSELVQPTTDALTSFISGEQGITWQRGAAVAASPASSVDVGVALALTEADSSLIDSAADRADRADSADPAGQQVAAEPLALVAPAPLHRPAVLAPADAEDGPAAPAEDAAVVPEPVPVASEPAVIETPVDVPAQVDALVVANSSAPVALAPVARPTETRRQTADRLNAENQAAIDAARSAQVRAKADADAANQTAIDARHASRTADPANNPLGGTLPDAASQAAVGRTTGPQRPAAPSTPEVPSSLAGLPADGPPARGTSDASNQAAIDAAKLAHAQSRTQSNDANQTAIDSARLARVPVKATLAATPAPVAIATPAPPQPQFTPEPIATDPPTAPAPSFDMQAPSSDEADEPSDGSEQATTSADPA